MLLRIEQKEAQAKDPVKEDVSFPGWPNSQHLRVNIFWKMASLVQAASSTGVEKSEVGGDVLLTCHFSTLGGGGAALKMVKS